MDEAFEIQVRAVGERWEMRMPGARAAHRFDSLAEATHWATLAAYLAWVDRCVPARVRIVGDAGSGPVAATFSAANAPLQKRIRPIGEHEPR